MRLDRYLQSRTEHSLRQVRKLLSEREVEVDHSVVTDPAFEIDRFSTVICSGYLLNQKQPVYLMLHKPAGVVSSTEHREHPTVIDLIPGKYRGGLHIAGRLDLKTTGLLLLTNDGQWSRKITQPENSIPKRYHVTTQDPVHPDAERVFREGIYFSYEGITTRPALLQRLSDYESLLTINEGRYHQVKRMFGYFDNEVTKLHREQIGELSLDPDLKPGDFRCLTGQEIALF